MTTDIKKKEFLGKLGASLPEHVSLPVVHAIVDQLDPILGVAFARYEKYAEVSATGLRTVARTIPALHVQGLLRKQSRHNGPPVLWLPEVMDMQVDEAVRRAAWLAHHKDENPQNYFRASNGNVAKCAHARRPTERSRVEGQPKTTGAPNSSVATGMQLKLRQQRPAKAKSPAHANDREILRLVHSKWDVEGITPEDPRALTKAIHAVVNARPECVKHLDARALRKAIQRARGRLPAGYDRWIGLVEKWDKSYDHRKARDLVDRLLTAVGDRPSGILSQLFDHLEQQICDHLPKKVGRLECEHERLKQNKYYMPQLRSSKRDEFGDRVYAALAEPKTKKQLVQMFGRSYDAISTVGLRLRKAGLIKTFWRDGRFMWARADAAPLFVPAREAIVAALKEGPLTIPALAQKSGRGTATVKSALHRHLLSNGTVIRTKLGFYALAGTEPSYVSRGQAIVAALKKGPMTFQALAREINNQPSSLPQFLEPLLAKGTVIRTKRGIYALPGSAPVYIPTSDAIISVLWKRPMKLGLLVQQVNKLTKSTRSRGAIGNVLNGLIRQGRVGQERRYGEYRLVRRARRLQGRKSARRKGI
jgi:predicted transcriptional regulator